MSALIPFPAGQPSDVRLEWLRRLATLVRPLDPKGALAAMQPFLELMGFPPEAYCPKSLRACAEALKHVPSYGELNEALGKWWRDHRPWEPGRAPAPALPAREPPTEAEISRVHALVAGIVADLKASAAYAPRSPRVHTTQRP